MTDLGLNPKSREQPVMVCELQASLMVSLEEEKGQPSYFFLKVIKFSLLSRPDWVKSQLPYFFYSRDRPVAPHSPFLLTSSRSSALGWHCAHLTLTP